MRVLVTGGTGHLGRALVDGLRRQGHDVRILPRTRRAPLPKRVQAAIAAGNTSATARLGTTTWEQWLRRSRTNGGRL